MEFAWNLRIAGERVRFNPRAKVYGEMVSRGGAGAASQRRRWETGRASLRETVRRGLWKTPYLSSTSKMIYQLDLDFPPLGKLAVQLTLISMIAAAGFVWNQGSAGWLAVLGLVVIDWAILIIYASSPVYLIGLPVRYLFSAVHLPYYLGWKLAVGLIKKPQQWVRTPREVPPPD